MFIYNDEKLDVFSLREEQDKIFPFTTSMQH